jgi:UDP-glucose 4-epimerase
MNILVTGSTGGIGHWTVKRLVEIGHQVRALDIKAQPKSLDFEYWNGDVRDISLMRRATYGMEAVVHLAAIPFDMPGQDEQILDTNLRGTYCMLLAAQEAGVRRVVSFSSINALGQAEPTHPGLYLPLDDDIPHHNVKNYSLTKHLGEEMCQAFSARGVFSAVSLRPSMVLQPDAERRWWDMLPEEFKLRGHIADFFSYVDVRDVAEAVALALDAPVEGHRSFLLTSPESRIRVPTGEIVEKHYPNLPWPKIPKDEYLARDEFISLVDSSAAVNGLGWRPKYSRFDPAAGYDG